MNSAFDLRFKATGDYEHRNPHMRGTTSVLRLLFGLPLGTDYESEFISIEDERVHIFDAFALANYLLCSAVGNDGKARGKATDTMLKNCRTHFREAVQILQPSVIVVQGKGFWPSVSRAFDSVKHLQREVYSGTLGSAQTLLAAFTHPSSPQPSINWGTNERTVYLRETIVPAIAYIRAQLLAR